MIELNQLTKYFGKIDVVKAISLSIREGEVFGLLGPNGAGKTTTFRLLIGLLHPSAGYARIGGHDCVTERDKVHQLIGFVPEMPNLYERISVRDNLSLFANLWRNHVHLDEIISRLKLNEVADKPAGKLSKGWQQRVLIARALLHRPRVLFLDEPTSGLDPNSALVIRGLIQELNSEGVTIVLSTHNMHEADELCDRIGFIYEGRLVALDTPENLKSGGSEPMLEIQYVEDNRQETKIFPLNSLEAASLIYEKLPRDEILSITTKQRTLADVFTNLTGGELN